MRNSEINRIRNEPRSRRGPLETEPGTRDKRDCNDRENILRSRFSRDSRRYFPCVAGTDPGNSKRSADSMRTDINRRESSLKSNDSLANGFEEKLRAGRLAGEGGCAIEG